jgi:hypothetical protein
VIDHAFAGWVTSPAIAKTASLVRPNARALIRLRRQFDACVRTLICFAGLTLSSSIVLTRTTKICPLYPTLRPARPDRRKGISDTARNPPAPRSKHPSLATDYGLRAIVAGQGELHQPHRRVSSSQPGSREMAIAGQAPSAEENELICDACDRSAAFSLGRSTVLSTVALLLGATSCIVF